MSKSSNLIRRREVDPLLLKAQKIVKHYEKAADCAVSVLGPEYVSAEKTQGYAAQNIYSLCGKCCRNSHPVAGNKNCYEMHLDAINEAKRLGGAYVYVCQAGFAFWTSPLYSGDRFAGALLSGGVLGVAKQQAADYFFRNCTDGEKRRAEIEYFLSDIPEKNSGEVKALARMMNLCADQISENNNSTKTISSVFDAAVSPEQKKPEYKTITLNTENQGADNSSCQMDKERMLLASLRRGDNTEALKILKKLLNILYKTTENNFSGFRLKAMELAVLLSRSVSNPQDIEDDSVMEITNRYLKKIEKASSLHEISEIFNAIIDRISGKIFSFQGVRHSSALRKAERFIWENYTRKISLQEISNASGLSAPYFSTIFKDEMGENLSNYLNRLRIEKAGNMLATTNIPISKIAAACGFEDQSWFSKLFKNYTGLSPGKYRERGGVLN
ncbi:MAG: helix-turn-helix domain-containing protein [Treponema sp.]|nr:helix-turn-helix domain-containing protein [Treponema sp.]